jgi:hypothetical protein
MSDIPCERGRFDAIPLARAAVADRRAAWQRRGQARSAKASGTNGVGCCLCHRRRTAASSGSCQTDGGDGARWDCPWRVIWGGDGGGDCGGDWNCPGSWGSRHLSLAFAKPLLVVGEEGGGCRERK